MIIGGLQKTSLIDYPDKVSAIIFTVGCNFRCGFCYNSELVIETNKIKKITEEEFFKFLEKRKKILDAVVITGGEPTIHKDLPEFIGKIRRQGYLVKLDTNGINPEMLKKLVRNKMIDYMAMDIKGPLRKYDKIVNIKFDKNDIKKSIKIIMNSGLPYEFRSTILPKLHLEKDVVAMAKMIRGAEKYYLQKFVPSKKLLDSGFKKFKSYTDGEMKELGRLCKEYVGECKVR